MVLNDSFSAEQVSPPLESPGTSAAAVTPGVAELDPTPRALYVGVTGDVEVTMYETGTDIVFTAVPAGSVLPIRVSHVTATNTTATNIVAIW